ncbi:hypothetical protein BpHYR1_004672 [Brachionus plicatilis]|uniref:Uncharacterized protein n=1 Tax=Brachionus plicatilis TaxID=10195 RepID=A0A3M7RZF9_BRAPC|nr:hypothetical protein BpHYR1_004672 [Brachionus plicatilis]
MSIMVVLFVYIIQIVQTIHHYLIIHLLLLVCATTLSTSTGSFDAVELKSNWEVIVNGGCIKSIKVSRKFWPLLEGSWSESAAAADAILAMVELVLKFF